jgi:hypothetical protein
MRFPRVPALAVCQSRRLPISRIARTARCPSLLSAVSGTELCWADIRGALPMNLETAIFELASNRGFESLPPRSSIASSARLPAFIPESRCSYVCSSHLEHLAKGRQLTRVRWIDLQLVATGRQNQCGIAVRVPVGSNPTTQSNKINYFCPNFESSPGAT